MDQQTLSSQHRNIWDLIKIFWQSDQRRSAYLFFAAIMAMTLALVGFDVVFTYWYNHFYNALQAYDKAGAYRLLMLFILIAALYISLSVYRFYITQLFAWRWRRWLTQQFITRWLQNRGYYYLEAFDKQTDNPDQRIQEDIGSLITLTISLFTGLVSSIVTFFAFIYVLWSLSGILSIPLGSLGTLHLHGYLVWVSLIYSTIGSLIAIKVGWPLVGLTFEQQHREATFRFSAIDLRYHAEQVALYNGEEQQKGLLQKLFGRVLDNWYAIILRQKMLLWFTAGYSQTAVLLPLLVIMPNYFDKVFLLGGFMQSLSAFRSVQDSLSYIVSSYSTIAEWQAVGKRLTTFVEHLGQVQERVALDDKLKREYHAATDIQAKQISITTPQGRALLDHINQTFEHGKHYLIKGDSGLGKSTFIKTLAGIWPFAQGEVIFPHQQIMYLPQRLYMPLGTLADAIAFPAKDKPENRAQLIAVLNECRLSHLVERLDEVTAWSSQLSPGEQQRVGFARVLLHKPDWIIMDESTSMLDMDNENYMYNLIKQRLPHCSIISIGHRPSLESHHDKIVDMTEFKAASAFA